MNNQKGIVWIPILIMVVSVAAFVTMGILVWNKSKNQDSGFLVDFSKPAVQHVVKNANTNSSSNTNTTTDFFSTVPHNLKTSIVPIFDTGSWQETIWPRDAVVLQHPTTYVVSGPTEKSADDSSGTEPKDYLLYTINPSGRATNDTSPLFQLRVYTMPITDYVTFATSKGWYDFGNVDIIHDREGKVLNSPVTDKILFDFGGRTYVIDQGYAASNEERNTFITILSTFLINQSKADFTFYFHNNYVSNLGFALTMPSDWGVTPKDVPDGVRLYFSGTESVYITVQRSAGTVPLGAQTLGTKEGFTYYLTKSEEPTLALYKQGWDEISAIAATFEFTK